MAKNFPIITLRTDVQPWERQEPRETELMYSRFLVFRDLGPESDRLRQALEVLNSTGDKLTYQTIRDYSSAFRWTPRAAAWDRYNTQADRARMVRRRRRAIDEQCKAAEKLRLKALEALHDLNYLDLSAGDIVRFVELAYKIEHSIYSEYDDSPVKTGAPGSAASEDIASWYPAAPQAPGAAEPGADTAGAARGRRRRGSGLAWPPRRTPRSGRTPKGSRARWTRRCSTTPRCKPS